MKFISVIIFIVGLILTIKMLIELPILLLGVLGGILIQFAVAMYDE